MQPQVFQARQTICLQRQQKRVRINQPKVKDKPLIGMEGRGADSKENKPFTTEEKYIIIKSIAKNYIKKGFGYKQAKELIKRQLNCQVTAAAYNNFMTTIARMAFRSLQQFLNKYTGKEIKPITYYQEQVIRSPMIQCRDWMSQQNVETFFKFICEFYELQTVSISIPEAISLYKELFTLIENSQNKESIIKEKKLGKSNERIENQFNKAESMKISGNRDRKAKNSAEDMKDEQKSGVQKTQGGQSQAGKQAKLAEGSAKQEEQRKE